MRDLTEIELIYLRSVARMKWYSAAPFGLDVTSVDLILKGYLEADIGRGIYWKLTDVGREALNQQKRKDT